MTWISQRLVRWRLGGSHSSFRLGSGTRFYWQHDAEFQPGGLISLFDNGSDPPKEKQSRGLLLDPSTATHSVSLVKQFVNPTKTLLASSQGNTLSLPGGNWLMGYGGLPNFTEYDASGHVLFDATLGKNVQSFRTYLSPWSGTPDGAPGPGQAERRGMSVSVSWNGASESAPPGGCWRALCLVARARGPRRRTAFRPRSRWPLRPPTSRCRRRTAPATSWPSPRRSRTRTLRVLVRVLLAGLVVLGFGGLGSAAAAGIRCYPPHLNASAALVDHRLTSHRLLTPATHPRDADQHARGPRRRAERHHGLRLAHGRPRRPAAPLLAGGRASFVPERPFGRGDS